MFEIEVDEDFVDDIKYILIFIVIVERRILDIILFFFLFEMLVDEKIILDNKIIDGVKVKIVVVLCFIGILEFCFKLEVFIEFKDFEVNIVVVFLEVLFIEGYER